MLRRVLVVVGVVGAVATGVLVVLGGAGAGNTAGSAAARWVLTDLGTLGGKESAAVAINEHGQIVGYSDTGAKENGLTISHAFLWQNRKMTDLGTLGGGRSSAVAINEHGQIIGWSGGQIVGWSDTRTLQTHTVLWTLKAGS